MKIILKIYRRHLQRRLDKLTFKHDLYYHTSERIVCWDDMLQIKMKINHLDRIIN